MFHMSDMSHICIRTYVPEHYASIPSGTYDKYWVTKNRTCVAGRTALVILCSGISTGSSASNTL